MPRSWHHVKKSKVSIDTEALITLLAASLWWDGERDGPVRLQGVSLRPVLVTALKSPPSQ